MSHWTVDRVETDLDRFHLGPVEFDLAPGRAVAVLGPSGAGKTTLLRTLAGFLRPSRGRILRDGEDVSRWPPEARSLGYVPQGLGLLPHRTVAGNLRYPLELRGRSDVTARTRELLERFRLSALADRYPARLSAGEQQRVAIARALAADPELVVWDEPWQALDVGARYELGLVLHELLETERIPVLVVTHDPSLAFSVADSFVVLHRGRMQRQSDAATLLRRPSDGFTARFVGYENVYDRASLDGGAVGSFRSWLRSHAGPDGLAFPSPVPVAEGRGSPAWEGTVRSARPGPSGLVVEVVADDLFVTLRLPPPMTGPLPVLGGRLRFEVDPSSLQPLESRSGPEAAA